MPGSVSIDDLKSHLALALVPNLGPGRTASVIAKFGSAAAALKATYQQLVTIPGLGEKLASQFAEKFRTVNVDAEWELIQSFGISNLILGRPDYPERLAQIPNAPPLLYLRGEISPVDVNAVGIVGSRVCTSYGRKITEKIASGLARAGWTVVSGLARGIDGEAHRAALNAGGRTIAVLAGGLSRIYPPEHKDLAEQIVSRGCLVTETPMTVEPQPGMFPARNRIISGLSRAVVIVEANLKSGALITATHAAEQGREVFAVPGPADSPASAGCLDLIRKGVRLVRNADDILEDLKGIAPIEPPKAAASLFDSVGESGPRSRSESVSVPISMAIPSGLDDSQMKVWSALDRLMSLDELTRLTAIPVGTLSMHLMQLELKKAVKRLPGNQFERR
ncbi:MAG: DNA-processing protein DprA [Gemmataceae bacterium]